MGTILTNVTKNGIRTKVWAYLDEKDSRCYVETKDATRVVDRSFWVVLQELIND